MPYGSKAQSRFMHAKKPKIAKKWDKEQPNQVSLPERKAKMDAYKRAMDKVN